MSTRAAVGHSQLTNARAAGQQAARVALDRLGGAECVLALLYATAAHDPAEIQAGVREVLGNVPRIFGGQTVGVITTDRVAERGYEVGIAVIASDSLEIRAMLETHLDRGEFEAGVRLARALAADGASTNDVVMLLTYDIMLHQSGTVWDINLAGPLLEGMSSEIPSWPTAIGGGMVGDNNFAPAVQWADGRMESDAALGVVLSGSLRADSTIMHGCAPAGAYHTITSTDGVEVIEIDEKPALDVIYDLVGPQGASDIEGLPMLLTLGVNHGGMYDQYREDDYVICVCRGVDTERRRLVMYNDNLVAGSKVQLMRRRVDFDDVRSRTRELMQRVEGRRPVLAIYADCWARRSVMCGTTGEDAEVVRQTLGESIPLLGFYVGSEITTMYGRAQATNFTGVLTLLSEEAHD